MESRLVEPVRCVSAFATRPRRGRGSAIRRYSRGIRAVLQRQFECPRLAILHSCWDRARTAGREPARSHPHLAVRGCDPDYHQLVKSALTPSHSIGHFWRSSPRMSAVVRPESGLFANSFSSASEKGQAAIRPSNVGLRTAGLRTILFNEEVESATRGTKSHKKDIPSCVLCASCGQISVIERHWG